MLTKKVPVHLWVAASSWLSRIISALIQIVSIRIIISILGADGYAAFILLSGLVAWGALSDYGVGNSLQNYISERKAANKSYNPIIVCSSIFVFSLMLVTLAILYLASPAIAGFYLKGFSVESIGDKNNLFFISMSIFCFTCFGSILFKIWYAEQKGWLANIVSCSCTTLGFLIIFSLYSLNVKINLLLTVICFFGPLAIIPTIFLLKFNSSLFKKNRFEKKYVRVLLGLVINRAKGFFLFSLMGTIVLQADYLVMSQKLEPADIVIYSVLMKIFGFVFFIYSALLQALWPVCVEYRVKKKWHDLNKMVYQYISIGLFLVLISSLAIYYFHNDIFSVLAPSLKTNVSWVLFLLFGIYFVLRVWSDTFVMLLQSMNYLKPLWYLVPVQAVLSLFLQWFLAGLCGIYGILGGLILSFTFTVAIVMPIIYQNRISVLNR
ncbi:MATE family efflux transporter [Yokenella regensburgei]|uniref:MATE family efflux transporter n=1 Tax=Yokenella regensburgei TaxID=158877 RepID=UPI003ED99EB6